MHVLKKSNAGRSLACGLIAGLLGASGIARGAHPTGSATGAAAEPAPASVPPATRQIPAPATVGALFNVTLFGFVELDVIHDSTQSLNEAPGNPPIARGGTLAGDNGRTMFGARNSRLGFRVKGPESATIKASGILEMDFLGNQPQSAPSPAGSPAVTETAFFSTATFRMRHYVLRLETPIVDILAGQTWSLFGWQGLFFPNTVEIQGVPGELFARTPQLRLSHLFSSTRLGLEIAAAAARPVQRDSEVPDFQGGLRIILSDRKGLRTSGATGTSVDPLSVGVSGITRFFRVPEFSATPSRTHSATGWGISVDALVPVIATEVDNGQTALTVTASYVRGRAIADLYSTFTGGITFPALPSGTFPQDVDNGPVDYSPDGVLHPITWQSVIVGIQYYPPLPVRVWLSSNYSHISSPDIHDLITSANVASAAKLFRKADWADGNVFVDITSAVRFGLGFAWVRQLYLDGVVASNQRVQFSSLYIF